MFWLGKEVEEWKFWVFIGLIGTTIGLLLVLLFR